MNEDAAQICVTALGFLLADNEGVVVKHKGNVLVVMRTGDNIEIISPPKGVTQEHVGDRCVMCVDKEEAITKAALDPNGDVPG